MDAETKDTTDYVATISPELLNLKKDDDCCLSNQCCRFDPTVKLSCKFTTCSYMNYLILFLLFFVLFQIVFKLKLIYVKVSSILNLVSTILHKIDSNKIDSNKKPESKREDDYIPNLNYILDIIKQIDKRND